MINKTLLQKVFDSGDVDVSNNILKINLNTKEGYSEYINMMSCVKAPVFEILESIVRSVDESIKARIDGNKTSDTLTTSYIETGQWVFDYEGSCLQDKVEDLIGYNFTVRDKCTLTLRDKTNNIIIKVKLDILCEPSDYWEILSNGNRVHHMHRIYIDPESYSFNKTEAILLYLTYQWVFKEVRERIGEYEASRKEERRVREEKVFRDRLIGIYGRNNDTTT